MGTQLPLPTERGTAAPTFQPMSIVAKQLPISATAELLLLNTAINFCRYSVRITCLKHRIQSGKCRLSLLLKTFQRWTKHFITLVCDLYVAWSKPLGFVESLVLQFHAILLTLFFACNMKSHLLSRKLTSLQNYWYITVVDYLFGLCLQKHLVFCDVFEFLLHFASVIDDAKCIVVTRVFCVSVCLSAATRPHYCMDPDVTWGSGRGCPLVVHYWADLQSGHGLHCYGNITQMRNVSEYMLVLAVCLVAYMYVGLQFCSLCVLCFHICCYLMV